MSTSLLRFENVSRHFDIRTAVDNVSFEIAPQETLCLLGPSGCGKTTCLRLAAGIDAPSSGRIYIDDKCVSDAHSMSPPESRGIGFLFQDYALFPHLTIAQNIGFGLRRLRRKARLAIIDEMLTRVGLRDYAQAYPHTLSGGEQQRAALARALAPRPRLILMDEPFASLDPQLRDDMRDFVKSLLCEMAASALIVTHDSADAMRLATRIAIQNRGRLIQIDTPEQVYTKPASRAVAQIFSTLNEWKTTLRDGIMSSPIGDLPCTYDDGTYCAAVRVSDIYSGVPRSDDFGFEAHISMIRRIGASWLATLRLADGTQWSAHLDGRTVPNLGPQKFSIARAVIMLFKGENKI